MNASPQSSFEENRTTKYFIIFFILGTLFFVILSFYFFIYKDANSVVQLPISEDNPGIQSLRIAYVFNATLLSTNLTPQGYILITNLKEKNLPTFLVSNSTSVQQVNINGQTLLNPKELKKNDKLQIVAQYDIKEKTWLIPVIRVIRTIPNEQIDLKIVVPTIRISSPSSTVKQLP